MKPHKCPICLGTGNVSGGFYLSVPQGDIVYGASSSVSEKCRACDGKGIIWETVEEIADDVSTPNLVIRHALLWLKPHKDCVGECKVVNDKNEDCWEAINIAIDILEGEIHE